MSYTLSVKLNIQAARKYIDATSTQSAKPEIYILSGGMYNLQKTYGSDPTVMKDWSSEFWETYT